jgi:hypothetical protein
MKAFLIANLRIERKHRLDPPLQKLRTIPLHGTLKNIIGFDDFASLPSFNTPASKSVIAARSLLKEAREIIVPDRGWQHLPQTERGMRILRWGADMAALGWPADPKAAVIRWCSFAAPWLSDADLDAIVARTETSNKRYSPDDSARVLEITVADKVRLNLRQCGANDDPFYVVRNRIKLEKDAARKREYRAKKPSTGKRGRPALDLSPEERLARLRAQKADYAKRRRVENKSVTPQDRVCSGTELNSTPASSEPKKQESAGERCFEPTTIICRPLSFRTDGKKALELARYRLENLVQGAAESKHPEWWADVIEDSAIDLMQAERAVAAGEIPVLSEFGANGYYHWVWVDDADDFGPAELMAA